MNAVDAPAVTGTNDTAGARRIAAAFGAARDGGRIALIPYVVAGYPDAATSLRIALAAIDAGADLLEIGLPYSDPLADGATLQRASQVALGNGATLDGSLRLIEDIAAARPATPIVPMGYANQFVGGNAVSGVVTLTYEAPLRDRVRRAEIAKARLATQVAEEQLRQLRQQVLSDVRTARWCCRRDRRGPYAR